ncbi:MAG: hypothetical protein JNL81_13980 [Hyphomonadaceae bacterium]|nr:hypothetical protein [Hyphomonadaceae bacterium]
MPTCAAQYAEAHGRRLIVHPNEREDAWNSDAFDDFAPLGGVAWSRRDFFQRRPDIGRGLIVKLHHSIGDRDAVALRKRHGSEVFMVGLACSLAPFLAPLVGASAMTRLIQSRR